MKTKRTIEVTVEDLHNAINSKCYCVMEMAMMRELGIDIKDAVRENSGTSCGFGYTSGRVTIDNHPIYDMTCEDKITSEEITELYDDGLTGKLEEMLPIELDVVIKCYS